MSGRRFLPLLLAGALLVQTGCAGGRTVLEREDLVRPHPARAWEVTTTDGRTITFVALHLEGQMLLGTARYTETVTVGEGPEARETISNRYEETRIPWSEVDRVEAIEDGSRPGGGFLLAAVSVAAGIAAFLLITQDSEEPPPDGGNTK